MGERTLSPAMKRTVTMIYWKSGKVVAKVVPAPSSPASQPDFLARAKAIWGERPAGKPLSAVVAEARGGEP